MIHFIGDSFAAKTLKEGARRRGVLLTDDIRQADLVFVSQDTPTDKDGVRDLQPIRDLIDSVPDDKVLVITSQVPPGFCRALERRVYHQAETLRIEDGLQRAMYPEMFIVGCPRELLNILNLDFKLPASYAEYLQAFDCPVLMMTYEDAEFCKIAINMTLAAQVDNTNRLYAASKRCGADWWRVANVLRHDSRIGKYSYLTPGRWQDSPHLLRDYVTLKAL